MRTGGMASLNEPAWYCLKARPKHEHVAAGALRAIPVEKVFCPRIRFRKLTRRGPAWFVEALFPGYLFAKFRFQEQYRQACHANGVSTIVHFGENYPPIGEPTMAALMELAGDREELILIDPELKTGCQVQITAGALQGMEALVTQVLPARERVRVLIEFLGREMHAEVSKEDLIIHPDPDLNPFAGIGPFAMAI